MVNSSNSLISAQDYDAWGYLIDGRSYQSEESKFKFTGKERDKENNYDYFGARYYDARIANWTSIDPLKEKHYDFSPFNYVLRNPLRLIDPDGKDPRRDQLASISQVVNFLNENQGKSYWELGNAISNKTVRYIYTEKQGFIDLQHFFSAAHVSSTLGIDAALKAGESVESYQQLIGNSL
ncbi:MAG: RHS repeat-associated core domain-containing protein [bacterium]